MSNLNQLAKDYWNDELECEVIEEGDWVNDFEDYYFRIDIIKYQDKYYRISMKRTGSYYTEYFFNEDSFVAEEVTKVEKVVTVTSWERVK
jgi:hypothetical protein